MKEKENHRKQLCDQTLSLCHKNIMRETKFSFSTTWFHYRENTIAMSIS